jgi:hypothetical protein
MIDDDDELRPILGTLSPSARAHLRYVLIRDQADRDAISSRPMRYREQNGQDRADIIDFFDDVPGRSTAGGAAVRGTQGRGAFLDARDRRGLGGEKAAT